MKTVMIFDDCQAELKFYIFDGDLSHLHEVYFNSFGDEKEDELQDLIYNDQGEELSIDPVTIEQATQAIRDGAILIVCGFVP